MAKGDDPALFLDSGAFSAWARLEKLREKEAKAKTEQARQLIEQELKDSAIDIYRYIEFIKQFANEITVYANLDVIGDAEATLKNQKIMEEAGLTPLPCFHRGEDFKYLHYYVENYDYLALGGVAKDRDRNDLIAWLNKCWDVICDAPDRLPKVRIHGFGITSFDTMVRYPWYSVDSTSWLLTGGFGSIFVPKRRNGKWIYTEQPWVVTVSNESAGKSTKGQHFLTMGENEQALILDYLKAKKVKLGKSTLRKVEAGPGEYKLQRGERWINEDLEPLALSFDEDAQPPQKGKDADGDWCVEMVQEPGVSNDYQLRDHVNILFFRDLEANMPKWPWPYKRKGLTPFDLT